METRTFGEPPVGLSVLGLGCSKVGSMGNPTPMAEVRRTLARAIERGVTVFDTASIYGQGDSEREIGRALGRDRDAVFVMTKVGKTFSWKMRLARPIKPLVMRWLPRAPGGQKAVVAQRDGNVGENFAPGAIAAELDASLRRLGFGHVDGLLLHSPPAAALARTGVAETLQALRAAGKVRFFGVSVDDHACLEAALRLPGLTLIQAPFDVLDAAAESGLGTEMARRRMAVFGREVRRARPDLLPPQAVAWAAARPDVTCVIAGTTWSAHLDQLVDGLHVGEGTGADRQAMERAR